MRLGLAVLVTISTVTSLAACGSKADSADLEKAVPAAMMKGVQALGSPFSASAGVSRSDLEGLRSGSVKDSMFGRIIAGADPSDDCLLSSDTFWKDLWQSAEDEVHTTVDTSGNQSAFVEVIRYRDSSAATKSRESFKSMVKACANNSNSKPGITTFSNWDIGLEDTSGAIAISPGQSGSERFVGRVVGRQFVLIQLPPDGLADSQISTFSKAFYSELS